MKKIALIEKGKDGAYSVYPADSESIVVGHGVTMEEAIADFEYALKDFEDDLPEFQGVEFEYQEYKEE